MPSSVRQVLQPETVNCFGEMIGSNMLFCGAIEEISRFSCSSAKKMF
jgi:hypothetical protein